MKSIAILSVGLLALIACGDTAGTTQTVPTTSSSDSGDVPDPTLISEDGGSSVDSSDTVVADTSVVPPTAPDDGSVDDTDTGVVVADSSVGGGQDSSTVPDSSIPFRGCDYTQGWYKNHPTQWPMMTLTIGPISYDQTQMLALLNDPSVSDASVILAKQLIAALENGDPAAASTVQLAQTWMTVNSNGLLPYGITNTTTAVWQSGYDLGQRLDGYNSGTLGACHCP